MMGQDEGELAQIAFIAGSFLLVVALVYLLFAGDAR